MDDALSILGTYSRYAQAMADRRFDVYAEQFTADGCLDTRSGIFRGRDAIRQFNAQKYQGDTTTRVMWCNPVIQIEGDTARGSADYIVLGAPGDGGTALVIMTMGRYEDVFKREGGRWLIQSRRARDTLTLGSVST